MIKILDFIGKYNYVFIIISVIISYVFILPNVDGRTSMDAFLAVFSMFLPLFVALITFIIYLYVTLPLMIGKEINKQFLKN